MNIGKKQAHMGQDLVCACLYFLRIISKSHKKIRFLLSIYSESTLSRASNTEIEEKREENRYETVLHIHVVYFFGDFDVVLMFSTA